MAEEDAGSIVSNAEIEAALAQAESEASRIPSLDDGANEAVVPVPVETNVKAAPRDRPRQDVGPQVAAVAQPSQGPTPAEQAESAPRVAGWLSKVLRRVSSWMPVRLRRGDKDQESQGGRVGRIIYEAIDWTLWAVNRPFIGISPEARQLAGLVGFATIIMSVLAMYLLPLLSPPRDSISQLQRKSQAAQAAAHIEVSPAEQ